MIIIAKEIMVKHLTKIFLLLIILCSSAIIYFIVKDYKSAAIQSFTFDPPKPRDIEYKNDGKIHIVIDAGHGGRDVGAIGINKLKQVVYEKNIAKQMVEQVMAIADTDRYSILETRLGDSMPHRHDRMRLAKKFKPQLLISFHCNSLTNKLFSGTEIHICDSTLSKKDTTSIYNPFYKINKGFADTLLSNIGNAFPNIRKIKVITRKDRIWMIYAADFPSVLVEWGYISNANDIEIMQNQLAQKTLAKVIWKSVDKHFGFK